ncbi:hypothetical protein G4B88_017183 [Cannabis sativa]|uniref:DUF4283 domain-containing protein n=1 Tax=Cannabis sativa TaxID=3483 RepID=A0A7J6G0S5_CANSA|nr:hypothetical protein G4B88_017183 [Cannabis sativa]
MNGRRSYLNGSHFFPPIEGNKRPGNRAIPHTLPKIVFRKGRLIGLLEQNRPFAQLTPATSPPASLISHPSSSSTVRFEALARRSSMVISGFCSISVSEGSSPRESISVSKSWLLCVWMLPQSLILAKSWKKVVSVAALTDVPLHSNCFKFGFECADDRSWALENGPWSIRGYSLILLSWTPSIAALVTFERFRVWALENETPSTQSPHGDHLDSMVMKLSMDRESVKETVGTWKQLATLSS